MTKYFDAWQLALAQRDQTLVALAAAALCLVLAWTLVDYLPEKVRPWVRTIYLWSGIPLYIVTLISSLMKK
jgi:hypothetical protein